MFPQGPRPPRPARYAELHCKTNFSFLEGASHAEELVRRAAELGYEALAVTDRESLSGVVKAHKVAREVGLKLIVGAEMHPRDASPVVLWATDRASYAGLSRLITLGRRRTVKGACELYFSDLAAHHHGLRAGVMARTAWPSHAVAAETASRLADWHRYRDLFGERACLLAELHYGPDDRQALRSSMQLSQETRLPLVAAGDVHYHDRERIRLQDVLTAIRTGTTVSQLGLRRFVNAERHLRPRKTLQWLFAEFPQALDRTLEIAAACHFSLDSLRYEYPEELAPDGQPAHEYLRDLTWQGARWRYPQGVPSRVCQLVQHELQLIEDLHYEAYFLTVWDLVRFARSRGILCQGRGSAANSAVCYCLGITAVDPDRTDVLFERFISHERNEAPDIDVDFEHERREEVLQYLYDKYGRDRAGMTAEVITYQLRSAIRDSGQALGMSLDCVDALAKQVEGYRHDDHLADRFRQVGLDPESGQGREWLEVIETLVTFPRHLSQHVGGMVITRGPLCELVPLENAAMPGRTVICWDKYDLDDLGILKVDCLGLGMLTAIRKCFQLIERHTGGQWTLANIPPDDRPTYAMICRADTLGVFQIESRAQMSMLPRLRPRNYYDLVIEVAIVRPGPIQGQMVHPYLRRRSGLEPVEYANPEIRQVLEKTLGVPIFQEQAMKLAMVAAGFTPGEADQLRRAMGAWRKTGAMDPFRQKLIRGMRERGFDEAFAEQVFRQIRGFGEYGFPESHAASFALLVYVSAWLKCHYPAFFTAAMLNSQPLGFYAPAQLVQDARAHGVQVLPVDVNASQWDCTLAPSPRPSPPRSVRERGQNSEICGGKSVTALPFTPPPAPHSLRLGFRQLVGFSRRHSDIIMSSRGSRPFGSPHEFAQRTGLPRAVIALLAKADALASLVSDRRQALWQSLAQEPDGRQRPLFAQLAPEEEPPVDLPELPPLDQVLTDYATAGLSLRAHPIAFYRHSLQARRVTQAGQLKDLPDRRPVRVAGLVIVRQRPSTAKGITFVTLEDETGTANLVVRQVIWDRFYVVARRSPAWVVYGRLERKYRVTHVVAERIVDLADFLQEPTPQLEQHRSRDFR